MPFLARHDPRPLSGAVPMGWKSEGLFIGSGAMALEVTLLEAPTEPTTAILSELYKERRGKRATPVVVVVLWGRDRAAICGPLGDDIVSYQDSDRGQVERICDAALRERDRHGAIRFLNQAFEQFGPGRVSGLRNQGLFAMHELRTGVRSRSDWPQALAKGRNLLGTRGRHLVENLGFKIQSLPGPASVLVSKGTKIAVAVFLERPDEIEPVGPLFDGVSAVSYALAKADQENLDYVVISAGAALRVYPVKPGIGTGRRGRTETYIELNLDLLRDDDAAYLWLLASGDALKSGGSFTDILEKSGEYTADLSVRLRDRVYLEVVPPIAKALVSARRLRNPSAAKLAETYDMALRVLFRLLFVAYAEDKELLPLHTNTRYREHSLKMMARRLLDAQRKGVTFGREDFYWTEVQQLWKAVDRGNREWGVPQYNGGLFASEEADSSVGAMLSVLSLPDAAFAPALAALLLDKTEDEDVGPIDFRSLGVREFGTIYEGLLESELSVADTDLAVHPKTGAYLPAGKQDKVEVHEGEVYLHNASGARKSSGAYYTKAFAVEHLLDRSLEPALDDHLVRLDALSNDRDAGEKFFEFRAADIAMGSGHFLVAAIDRIERRLSNYLARRPLAVVMDELERLKSTAREALGEEYAGDAIEDTQFLRRQIARRCIYGVDLNPMAVELARLSIWIHTFVPGLPLSFLDQNLVVGNSLVGIATFDEANEILSGPGLGSLFSLIGVERLAKAREPIEKLARLADATAAEVKQAKKLYEQARTRIQGEEALLTVLTASRIDDELRAEVEQGNVATRLELQGDVFSDRLVRKAEKALRGLDVLHFPITFPQVFLGARAGFDVILGNPPWEKARVEELEFWARHFPGLRGVSTAERVRQLALLIKQRPDLAEKLEREKEESAALRDALRGFPGMNTGHPDLFRAFSWRFTQLLSSAGGWMGIVLPGDAFKIKGATPVREIFAKSFAVVDIQMATNKAEWVFEGVHASKLVALVTAKRGDSSAGAEYRIRAEVHDLATWERRTPNDYFRASIKMMREYSPSLVVPILPQTSSSQIIEKMMGFPRLRNHPVFPISRVYADFETTRDRERWHTDQGPDDWPVYKGESFDLWKPDTGTYFGFTSGNDIARAAHERRTRAPANTPYSRTSLSWRQNPETHPVHFPRIAFRDVTNRTNRRTFVVALIPPQRVTTQTAPWVLWRTEDEKEKREALLLGVLSSLPVDWWMRRFVEGHVDQEAFECIPVPVYDLSDPQARRVIDLAGRLAAIDERFAGWAQQVGVPVHGGTDEEREERIAELDAAVGHMYGLTKPDLIHVFETYHDGWDYKPRLNRVLFHLRALTATT